VFEPTKDERGRTIWLATFHRWWWSKDAVLVCATDEASARHALERDRPDLARGLRMLRPAPPPIAIQAFKRPPLSRQMTMIEGE
jgi:hypothetical protein